jgi:uncharacterized membrane protein
MKHVINLMIKFLMVSLVLFITLNYLTDLSLGQILFVSILVTIPAYFIGDIFILRRTNNTIATIADIGLTFVILYLANYFIDNTLNYVNNIGDISMMDALIASIFVGVGEWFFHKYVIRTDKTVQS